MESKTSGGRNDINDFLIISSQSNANVTTYCNA